MIKLISGYYPLPEFFKIQCTLLNTLMKEILLIRDPRKHVHTKNETFGGPPVSSY